MKKSEMQSHHSNYTSLVEQLRETEECCAFDEVVADAKLAWPHIDGMLRYARKHLNENVKSIEALDLVLLYAPAQFDHQSLDELEHFLATQKRMVRSIPVDMQAELTAARELMWRAHHLWSCIERGIEPEEMSVPEQSTNKVRPLTVVVEQWLKMGLLESTKSSTSQELRLITRFRDHAFGKCPHCGSCAKATKSKLLEDVCCPSCHQFVHFVLLDHSVPPE